MTNLSRCLALLLAGLAPGWVQGQDYTFVVGFRSMEVGVGQPPNPSLQSYFTVDDQTRAEVGPLTVSANSFPNSSTTSTAQIGAVKSLATVKSQDQTWLRNLSGGSWYDNALIYNVWASASGSALASDQIVQAKSSRDTTNYLFRRDRQLDFGLDWKLVEDVFKANATNPNFFGHLYGGYLTAASLVIWLFDIDTSQEVLRVDIRDYVQVDSDLTGWIPENGDLASRVDARTTIDRQEGGVLVDHSEIPTDRSNLLIGSSALNYILDVDIVAGHHYALQLWAGCQALLSGVYSFSAGAGATCDASHSAYWNGITAAFDPDGHPIPVASLGLVSESGFDYRYASPLSPNPAAVSSVPESAVWQLMLAALSSLWLFRNRSRDPVVRRKVHALATSAG